MTELNCRIDAAEVASIIQRVSDVSPDNLHDVWNRFDQDEWPALFALIDFAADFPQIGRVGPLVTAWSDAWPQLSKVAMEMLALQVLVDHPVVPPQAVTAPVRAADEIRAAGNDLNIDGCTTIDFFLEPSERTRLDNTVSELWQSHAGCWQQLQQDQSPELFELMTGGLQSPLFRKLTNLDLQRDEFTLTLALQSLDTKGIGWHRDLYWPREWLGEDVLAVFYGIGDEPDGKGGEFVYYCPDRNDVVSVHRRRHQTTILSNGKQRQQRILHAVAEFQTLDSSRHLVILQCRRAG